MKEPTRLCDSDELPPTLRAAFRSLDQGAPSAETALRVQRALQALPAVAPGAAAAGTFGLAKLVLVTTLMAGAVTSAVLVRQRGSAPIAAQKAPTAETAALPAAAATTTTPSRAATSVAAHAPASARPKAAATAPEVEPVASQAAAGASSSQASEPQDFAHTSAGVQPAQRGRVGQTSLRTSLLPNAARKRAAERARAQPAQAGVAPAEAAAEIPSDAEPTPARALRAPEMQANEAALLAQAKRLAGSDAAEALRKVEALAQQYPHGTFVQERELLAIQLHQRLGHTALAAELIQRFHERFPHSVYRRTLAP